MSQSSTQLQYYQYQAKDHDRLNNIFTSNNGSDNDIYQVNITNAFKG